jgi:hypothetical protein
VGDGVITGEGEGHEGGFIPEEFVAFWFGQLIILRLLLSFEM